MWNGDTATLTGAGEPEEIRALQVTDGILPMLGALPVQGRLFTRHDDSPDGNETVILTHAFWQSKFGGRASIVGKTILLDGRPREVIGVLPAKFRFLDQTPAIFLPIAMFDASLSSSPPTVRRSYPL